jgi:CheY-like chemotaxis protein
MIPLGNVLVVDDEQPFFETYRDILSREGYHVDWAPDRDSALEKLRASVWDVVILDQRLRGEAGGDVGIDLVSEIVPTGAKVIVATAYADERMIERAFKDGAYDYLEKLPTLPMMLRIKVRNASEAVRERRLAALSATEREKEIRALWAAARTEADRNRKGRILEDLMVLLFRAIPGFTDVDTRRKGPEEEIDILIRNESAEPFWARDGSQYILVECKNWSKPAGPTELVVFRDKMLNRGGRCRLGFFIAVGGFTEGFSTRTATYRKDDLLVVPVGTAGIDELVNATDRNAVLKKLHGDAVMAGNGHH